MHLPRKLTHLISITAFFSIAFTQAGCFPAQDSTSQTPEAINEIRRSLELPELPLVFVETTGMLNSPSGYLEVAVYQDSEGRKYSIDPKSNQIVEIDARTILSNIPSYRPSLLPNELKAKAMEYAKTAVPDFDSLQASLQYEEGTKGDNYFFTWYGDMNPGSMMRPFIQIGLHKSGILFAYYNTLSPEK